MSAFAGIIRLDGAPVQLPTLERMSETFGSRGADASGMLCNGIFGASQGILHVTPEPVPASLPFTLPSTGHTIVADARIDNRAELLSGFDIPLGDHHVVSDLELILRSYLRWGEESPAHLEGDFSFVIWDEERENLFAARDHFGTKPFVYCRTSHAFFFASEIKALLRSGEITRKLNRTRVADYLITMFEDTSSTLYDGIFRLPPAHRLTLKGGVLRIQQYWELPLRQQSARKSDEDWIEEYRTAFSESVRCRLRSISRVGVLASGGLDSSSVYCAAKSVSGIPPDLYSGIYEHAVASDEKRFAGILAAHGNVTPVFGHPDTLSPLTHWEVAERFEDELLWNPQMSIRWSLFPQAEQRGVRVMLDGFGGDGVVSNGLVLLPHLIRRGRLLSAFREGGQVARRHGRSTSHLLWRYGLRPLLPPAFVKMVYRLRGGREAAWGGVPLRKDYVAEIGLSERIKQLERHKTVKALDPNHAHYLQLQSRSYVAALECMDRVAAMHNIESRHPYFDKRVVELCISIPPHLKLNGGWTRYYARKAMEGIAPPELCWRNNKGDLSHGFHYALLHGDTDLIESVLYRNLGHINDYVDVTALESIYQRYRKFRSNNDGFCLWRVALIARWLGQYWQ